MPKIDQNSIMLYHVPYSTVPLLIVYRYINNFGYFEENRDYIN